MSAPSHGEIESSENSTVISLSSAGDGGRSDEEPASVPDLDTDAVFLLLKNSRRRDVLRYLAAHPGEVPIGEVAEYVAARENEIPVTQLSSKQRKRVYVALYQCHLPMMADYNVIVFNRPRGRLKLAPNAPQLEPYLNEDAAPGSRWSEYLTITVFGGLLYLFGGLLVGPDSWFTTLTVAGLLVAMTVLTIRDGREEIITAIHSTAPDSISRVLRSVLASNKADVDPATNDTAADD